MCKLCDFSNNPSYSSFIDKMTEQDSLRMKFTHKMVEELSVIKERCFSSIKLPVKLVYPMFEARAAFAVPNNYFQNLLVDGERASVMFSHGSMRSVFFAGSRLILFSKNVNFKDGKEYFTSFLLCHFDSNEYDFSLTEDDEILMHVDSHKSLKNLITGKLEKRQIQFNFTGKSVMNRIVSREQVKTSSQFTNVYSKYGGVDTKVQSIDLEGYAITVQHFSPHPYMLQLFESAGFASARDMQEHVIDYFKEKKAGMQ
ncbi:MAG: hypothetical protein ABII22_06785 [Candidatus Micrarchaeota archaeon]